MYMYMHLQLYTFQMWRYIYMYIRTCIIQTLTHFSIQILQLTVHLFSSDSDSRRMQRNIIHYCSLLHPGYGSVIHT